MKRGLLIASGILATLITLSIAAGNLVIQVAVQAAWRVGGQ